MRAVAVLRCCTSTENAAAWAPLALTGFLLDRLTLIGEPERTVE